MIRKLNPTIVRKIWGGKKLEVMKGIASFFEIEPIGETWEIYEDHLPYLAKFIDTSEELSIQVHPSDDYARIHENSSGKTECWIILEAAPEAGIYLGLKSNVTKDILKKALLEKKPIDELLNFYSVKAGDFFYVPAGSIHAIGKNVTLAEVQQNSGITYRVWDWNRVDSKGVGRELHIDKSLDVINFESIANTLSHFQFKNNLFKKMGLSEVCLHPNFHLFILNLSKGEKHLQELKNLTRPCSLLNLAGKIKINNIEIASYDAIMFEDENQLKIEAIEDGPLLLIF